MDHVVGEVQGDFIQWKIGVLDFLGEHDVAVAIVARKRSGSVGMYGELPDLKFLGGDSLVVGLYGSDFIQKPIRPAVLGNMLRAVGVENVAVDPVPIPISLPVNCARSLVVRVFVVIMCASFLEVTPTDGGERGNTNSRVEGAESQATVE